MLFDRRRGSLTIYKNGIRLGTPVAEGISGDLCWFVACRKGEKTYKISMRSQQVPESVRDLDDRVAEAEKKRRELDKKPEYGYLGSEFKSFAYGEPPEPDQCAAPAPCFFSRARLVTFVVVQRNRVEPGYPFGVQRSRSERR